MQLGAQPTPHQQAAAQAPAQPEAVLEVSDDEIDPAVLNPALWTACAGGLADEVRHLLAGGDDMEQTGGTDNISPLRVAVKHGRVEVVRVLLQHARERAMAFAMGQHPRLGEGSQVLELDVGVVKMVLDYVSSKDTDGEGITALHYAICVQDVEVVLVLLEHGADVSAKSNDGTTPLHLATMAGHEEMVRALLQHGAGIDTKSDLAETPLHIASRLADDRVLNLLLDKGADVNAQTVNGDAALHFAVSSCHGTMVQMLLNEVADIDIATHKGETPLHLAVHFGGGDATIVQMLLDAGADTGLKMQKGDAALHLAVRCGFAAIIKILLTNGADVNLKGRDGETALHLAVQGRHGDFDFWQPRGNVGRAEVLALVELLLDHGADLLARTERFRETPLDIAILQREPEILPMLRAEPARRCSGTQVWRFWFRRLVEPRRRLPTR